MTVAIQTAFATLLQSTAAPAPTCYRVAPAQQAAPYVVYSDVPTAGPAQRTYGGGYTEDSLFLVSCVGRTQLEANTLAETIALQLDTATLAGADSIHRENWAPGPPPVPDQTRFVRAFYVRVKHTT